MTYRVNRKNMAVSRLMPRGKSADPRLKYIHVSPKGTTAINPVAIARVSLPKGNLPVLPALIPQNEIDVIGILPGDESIDLPAGVPATTGADYLVPRIDQLIPEPNTQTTSFTCNGEMLLKLLKVACEVTNDSDKTIRLRICPSLGMMRIDSYRQPGEQEFVGVIKELEYYGNYIPGDSTGAAPKPETKPKQVGIALKTETGRRFRG
jgi:hypothetical protein